MRGWRQGERVGVGVVEGCYHTVFSPCVAGCNMCATTDATDATDATGATGATTTCYYC